MLLLELLLEHKTDLVALGVRTERLLIVGMLGFLDLMERLHLFARRWLDRRNRSNAMETTVFARTPILAIVAVRVNVPCRPLVDLLSLGLDLSMLPPVHRLRQLQLTRR